MLLMLNVATLNRALAAAALAYQKDRLRSLVSAGTILTVQTNTNPKLSASRPAKLPEDFLHSRLLSKSTRPRNATLVAEQEQTCAPLLVLTFLLLAS